ncbi:MAG: SEC-C metal-binding domain-containing protein, partial [Oscillospiraceae bacterium]
KDTYRGWLLGDDELNFQEEELAKVTREDITKYICDKATAILKEKEETIGSDNMREFERIVLLRNVDSKWMEHIDAMDELRNGMGLRSYGQHDPYTTYRVEGFAMFDEMVENIRQDTTRMLISAQVKVNNLQREQVAKVTGTSGGEEEEAKKQPVRVTGKVGRNDPCPCGSGKKYKHCHGRPGAEKL